ncbi:hypothetical protein O181_069204 [Austropuccinia psidii MF-1]|uniref:Uncharacterized protein n=1 Tax=Austropuccinia psidii MF-1 TaxID=1389203 RepID=A0A9Q3EYU1_9BASI|nr:hypothetical protein [Austropuccinia psidii MF-1]
MLMRLHPRPDETLTLSPHLCPHHSLHFRTPTSSSPQLTMLTLLQGPQVIPLTPPSPALTPPCTRRSWSAFPTCLRRRLPSLPSYSAHPTCLQCCLPSLCSQCPPDMPPTLLTILTLSVPSQHASDATLKASYDPYPPAVPSG